MLRPEAKYAPAPLYSVLWQQAARRWAQRPVSFRQQWQEYPSPAFISCLAFIGIGLVSGILGLTGLIGRTDLLGNLQAPQIAADLIGGTAMTTRALLGEPAMVRHEPPAEVWQYRSEDCVLDVYVYDTVRHAEIRERRPGIREADTSHDSECLRSLRLAAVH